MMKLIILLPCLYLAVKDVSADCGACKKSISDEGFQGALGIQSLFEDVGTLDNGFCGGEVLPCYGAKGCDDEEVKVVADVAAYLCSDGGKAAAKGLSGATCSDDYPPGATLDAKIESCQAAVGGDACADADGLKSCLVSSGKEVCGAAMGTFIENVWDNAISASLNC